MCSFDEEMLTGWEIVLNWGMDEGGEYIFQYLHSSLPTKPQYSKLTPLQYGFLSLSRFRREPNEIGIDSTLLNGHQTDVTMSLGAGCVDWT